MEELKKKNAFLMRVAENSKGMVEKMGLLRKDKSMLELQLSVTQREKALALESISSVMIKTQPTDLDDSPVLLEEINLIEEQPLDIQKEFMGM